MKVGVVLPSYNQAAWLPKALEAYQKQEHPSTLIVVNDASTDETEQILNRPRYNVPYVNLDKNSGTAEAINTGVKILGNDLDALTWISSDNTMTQDWLSLLVTTMNGYQAGVVYGGFWYVKGKNKSYLFQPHTPDKLINQLDCYYGPAFLIRQHIWHEAGDHRGKISHDYDHWLRVEETCYKRKMPIIGVDRALCFYNAHDQRVTITRRHEFDAHFWQEEARGRRRK